MRSVAFPVVSVVRDYGTGKGVTGNGRREPRERDQYEIIRSEFLTPFRPRSKQACIEADFSTMHLVFTANGDVKNECLILLQREDFEFRQCFAKEHSNITN